jgi:hypothetical protein
MTLSLYSFSEHLLYLMTTPTIDQQPELNQPLQADERRWLPSWLLKLARKMGINEAIFYVLFSRGWSLFSGIVTLKLILLFLTPELQGYYYSINNLIQMQLFLELGLGLVIIHLASTEYSRLRWSEKNTLEGDDRAKQRLASLIRKTMTFYVFMGLLFLAIILPIGFYILDHAGLSPLQWVVAWILICVCAALKLALIPIQMIYAGLGKIHLVSRYQTGGQVFANIGMWVGLVLGFGLNALILYSLINVLFFNYNLLRRFWPAIKDLLTYKGEHEVSWKKEIWPFQSRSGFNVIADWIFLQSLTPIILSNQGAVEAGQIGATISLIQVFTALGGNWMYTRSVEFSNQLGSGKTDEAYANFKSVAWKSMPIVVIGLIGLLLGLYIINWFEVPYLSQYKSRLMEPNTALLLVLFVFSNYFFSNYRTYLRAYKKEPFFVYSIIYSIILFSSNIYFSQYSVLAMCISQFIVGMVFCILIGTYYFHKIRKKWDREVLAGLNQS